MRALLFVGLYFATFMAAAQSGDYTTPALILAAVATVLVMAFMHTLFGVLGGKTRL